VDICSGRMRSLEFGQVSKTNYCEHLKRAKKMTKNSPFDGSATTEPQPAPVPITSLVDDYTAAAQSKATKRSYSEDVRHFLQHGGTLPASPTMVAEYIANFAGILAVATLQHRLIALHRAHTDIGLPSP